VGKSGRRAANKIKTRLPETQKYSTSLKPPCRRGEGLFDGVAGSGRDLRARPRAVQDLKFREKEISGRNVNEIEIEAQLDGDYAGIVRCLNRLQRSKNTYVVDSLGWIRLRAAGRGTRHRRETVKVSLHLRSYFRKT